MIGHVSFVGSGPGDPELLTIKAINRLKQADVVLFDDLSSGEALNHVSSQATLIGVGKRAGRKSPNQQHVNRLLVEYALQGVKVVRLKSGDPGFLAGSKKKLMPCWRPIFHSKSFLESPPLVQRRHRPPYHLHGD